MSDFLLSESDQPSFPQAGVTPTPRATLDPAPSPLLDPLPTVLSSSASQACVPMAGSCLAPPPAHHTGLLGYRNMETPEPGRGTGGYHPGATVGHRQTFDFSFSKIQVTWISPACPPLFGGTAPTLDVCEESS